MKRAWIIGMIIGVFLPAGLVFAQAPPGAGIFGSSHDFSGVPAGTGVATGACTFCHTPHKAAQTRLLWNHTLSQNTYTWSDATHTVGGTPLPSISPAWTGPTKFCLSCHDGSVAVGDIFWFNATEWKGTSALDNTRLDSGPGNTATPAGDLMGNHPISHPYPYNMAPNSYNGTVTGSQVLLEEYVADPTPLGIRLFNDVTGIVTAGPMAGRSGLECSSCHDPHNGSAVQDKHFLLGQLGGNGPDYICTKCHIK
ncbi:MAG TPA: hypothetical protein VIU33_01795 [Nitrospiria bacterium]